jgi:hypothetical protein
VGLDEHAPRSGSCTAPNATQVRSDGQPPPAVPSSIRRYPNRGLRGRPAATHGAERGCRSTPAFRCCRNVKSGLARPRVDMSDRQPPGVHGKGGQAHDSFCLGRQIHRMGLGVDSVPFCPYGRNPQQTKNPSPLAALHNPYKHQLRPRINEGREPGSLPRRCLVEPPAYSFPFAGKCRRSRCLSRQRAKRGVRSNIASYGVPFAACGGSAPFPTTARGFGVLALLREGSRRRLRRPQ